MKPQVQATDGVTYAEKITKADRILDWRQPASQLLSQIRGLSPIPAAITDIAGETVKVFHAQVEAGDATQSTGMILDNGLLVNAGNGTALRLESLQRPGKNRQTASQFLQSQPLAAGAIVKNSILS